MKTKAALAIGFCLIASTGHAQGWMGAVGAFLQGDQEHYLQQQNIQRGYPAQVYRPSYGTQSQPSQIIFNGRVVTCFPLGNGFTSCQ